ncbi:hypothetical protein LCGC14_0424760 [marine sediment metagenome]|uniref:Helicase ATP-binding domain-containing protein n=1 Tax=marine sediment metagenome TaxID=412755 RepID=A0A0F9SVY9_9ZZZZ
MKLRDYQNEAIDSIYDYFRSNDGNPLIVIPTGGGKSVVQAEFVRGVITQYPRQRMMLLTHVQELLQQNGAELIQQWPDASLRLGYYSAGLKSRDTDSQITIAGIQSVYKRALEFGAIDLIWIDEAHLVPKKGFGMYLQFINELREVNPRLKIIGMTATPYRLDSGMLHRGVGSIFTDICYDTDILRLVRNGYLAPLTTRLGKKRADLGGVKIRGGEYVPGDLEKAMNKDDVVVSAVTETIDKCSDRKKWLVFCSGVKHAHHVRDEFRERLISSETITGETPKGLRAVIIDRFKRGEIRALTNINVLTTGFNVPDIDAMIVLRPTKSTGLHVQMMGRGMRMAPGKENCLVLDFAGNILKHGPLAEIKVKNNHVVKSPQKECPDCGLPCKLSAKECPDCGYDFDRKECPRCHALVKKKETACPDCGYEFVIAQEPRHKAKANIGADVMTSTKAQFPGWAEVDKIRYTKHAKPGKPPSMRVIYYCGITQYSEWICFEHTGYPRDKAAGWWRRHSDSGVSRAELKTPSTVDEAIERSGNLQKPTKILVDIAQKFPRILRHDFSDINRSLPFPPPLQKPAGT